MTELILKIAEIIYSNPSAYTQDKAIERATKIIDCIKDAGYIQPEFLKDLIEDIKVKWMEQLKDAGWKSPHEVKSLVFDAILYADDKQKEAIRGRTEETVTR